MSLLSWRRGARIVAGAALAAGLIGAGGCVSQDRYQQLQTAFNQAQGQLAAAEHDVSTLRAMIDRLKKQIADDNAMLNAQGGGTAALRQERDALQARLAQLQKQYNQLLALAGGAPHLPQVVNAALEQLAQQYPDMLQFNKKRGMLRFKSDLLFALGSVEVRPEARTALARFATILDMPIIKQNEIRIVGNTDDVPIRHSGATVMNPTNWYLSTNRAISVMYVLKRDGVSDRRMQVAGWGKTHPIAPNAPRHRGNPLNRRVDIFILPAKVSPNHYLSSTEQPPPATGGSAPAAAPRETGAAAPETVPVPTGQ